MGEEEKEYKNNSHGAGVGVFEDGCVKIRGI